MLYKSLKQSNGDVYFGEENIDTLDSKNFAKKFAILAQEHEIAFNFRVIELMHMSHFIHKQFLEKINSSENLTILSSIHDLNIASKYCDKLILMNRGKVVTYGDTNDVLTSSHIEEVFNVKTNIIPLEDGLLGIFFKSR